VKARITVDVVGIGANTGDVQAAIRTKCQALRSVQFWLSVPLARQLATTFTPRS
jgi:hypothetical protein